jgi:TusA-related sulfurtransferase
MAPPVSRTPQQPAGPAPPDDVLDTVGLYCPVPIIRTAERVRRLPAGVVLEVISDDRVILIDLPAWCRSTGHLFLGSRQEGDRYHLLIRTRATEGRRP